MKIYIASSWRNIELCKKYVKTLRDEGHEVDCFCDPSSGRYVFYWRDLAEDDLMKFDAKNFIEDVRVEKAFEEDKKWLDWADCVLMILPCGKSAHLEAGYAVGRNKYLYIVGDFPKGEFDVMYKFADGLFRTDEMDKLLKVLKHEDLQIRSVEKLCKDIAGITSLAMAEMGVYE